MGKGPNICKIEGCIRTCSRHSKRHTSTFRTICDVCNSTMRKYGITSVEREELLASQNRECKICFTKIDFYSGREVDNPTARAVVDHCHTTGKVRGILCNRCNLGLGHFKDSKSALIRAIAYLELIDADMYKP